MFLENAGRYAFWPYAFTIASGNHSVRRNVIPYFCSRTECA